MDIHKNARLSFRSREALVQHVVERALTLKAAAAAFSVTVKTATKWVQRYRALGHAGQCWSSGNPRLEKRETWGTRLGRCQKCIGPSSSGLRFAKTWLLRMTGVGPTMWGLTCRALLGWADEGVRPYVGSAGL
ncbi:MAG: hypothetical protein LAO18_10910 [Acidobacteriia bacterium]|jgi:hypothetical protein|nr:hypothetical protein [Terriglobia bacterium]